MKRARLLRTKEKGLCQEHSRDELRILVNTKVVQKARIQLQIVMSGVRSEEPTHRLEVQHLQRVDEDPVLDFRVELGRVTWPSKDETWEYTWKVLVLMIIAGILVWALDALLTPLIAMIIG